MTNNDKKIAKELIRQDFALDGLVTALTRRPAIHDGMTWADVGSRNQAIKELARAAFALGVIDETELNALGAE